ncbi:hypothetical protein Purlil1_9797 [Purpureocillium lilacinum]|uniref:Dipeptidyl aminopeptidase/acylaminoacyl peptidase n=1 Tax=Purpureocillium lilacinum TaxID=33203 RepID=A0ABR0BP88_PURLI|nr:hypothetical protein Purlil1_9797 [Purpureocillium lilacinum]
METGSPRSSYKTGRNPAVQLPNRLTIPENGNGSPGQQTHKDGAVLKRLRCQKGKCRATDKRASARHTRPTSARKRTACVLTTATRPTGMGKCYTPPAVSLGPEPYMCAAVCCCIGLPESHISDRTCTESTPTQLRALEARASPMLGNGAGFWSCERRLGRELASFMSQSALVGVPVCKPAQEQDAFTRHGSIDWRTGIREIGILPARILPPGNRQSRSRPPTGKPRFGPQVGLARAFGGINAGASALRTDFWAAQLGSRWVLHREAGGDDELIRTHMRPRSKPTGLLAPRYTSGLACHTICLSYKDCADSQGAKLGCPVFPRPSTPQPQSVMALLLRHFFPKNPSFGYEALRAAGYANCGGADIAEVIAICSRIKSGDEDCWLREWRQAADRALANAKTSLSKGNGPGARDAFLRASNYYRTAEFYRREDPFDDDLSKELAGLSTQAFYSAAELMAHATERVSIPYEGTTLAGTLMRPDKSDKPRPTIIVNGGFDSTREELGYAVAAAALDLGFNVLTFDGPGQGETLREQRLYFRADWEKVITPVVDFTVSQPWSDNNKLVILGVSMGGYLVARAAAFEHRAAAIIVNDGVYDFGSAFRNETPAIGKLLIRHGWDGTMNTLIRLYMRWDTGFKWGVLNGKWVFGVGSEVDVLRAVEGYTLEGLVDRITTPMLVLDAPDDHFLKGQPKELFDRLSCEKEFVGLTREEGASAHCHMGSGSRLNQVMFDYLLPRLGLSKSL